MPHGGGGGSHGGGSFSSSGSFYSGGGSHGGGSNGNYSSRPHYSCKNHYFPGCHKYVYYRNHRPYYYYSDSPVAGFRPNLQVLIAKVTFSVLILCPILWVACLVIYLAFNPPEKITVVYDDSIVVEDSAGIFEDTGTLESAMESFLDTTGIAPAVITVNNEDWENYYDSLELYAYDLYVNHFEDEYHFLIVYSEPETVDTDFNDWYWQSMVGDDTSDILTDSVVDDFTESLQEKLLASSRYTVDEAIAQALTETADTCMESDVGIGGIVRGVIGIIVVVGIFWLMFFAGWGKKKAMKDAKRVPISSGHLEVKCEYCSGVYLRGTCTSCPHCGAPIQTEAAMNE